MEIVVVIGGPTSTTAIQQWLTKQTIPMNELLWIGVDGGAMKLVDAHLPMRLAIGDFDSISEADRDRVFEAAMDVKQFPSEKDNTDFEEALLWIQEHYPETSVHVLGAFGGRVDHALSCVWTAFRPDLAPIVPYLQFEDATNHLSYLLPGTYTIRRREEARYLSFITMTPVSKLTLIGTKYPLTGRDYAVPMALISNEFLGDEMTVTFETGLILVGQTRDAWR